MTEFVIFQAIKTTWKDLFIALLLTNPKKLLDYIVNDEYFYIDNAGPSWLGDFGEFIGEIYDHHPKYYNTLKDIDYRNFKNEDEIIEFLLTLQELFEEYNLLSKDVLIEIEYCSSTDVKSIEEQSFDVDDENREMINREKLEQIAKEIRLNPYQIRTYIRTDCVILQHRQ